MRRAIVHMVHTNLGNSFNQWRYAAAVWLEGKQQSFRVQHAMAHWQMFNCSNSLNSWRAFCEQRQEEISKMMRTLQQWKALTLSSAVQIWRTECAQQRYQQFLVTKAVIHMTHRQLVNGIRTWQAMSAYLLRVELQAAGHWLNTQLVASWIQWSDAVQQQKRQSKRMHQALIHWASEVLSRALALWVEQNEFYIEQLDAMRYATAHWGSSALAMAVHTWYQALLNTRASTEAVTRVAGHWQSRACDIAVEKWRIWSAGHAQSWERTRQAAGFFTYRQLSYAMDMWRTSAKVIRARLENASEKALAYWHRRACNVGIMKLSDHAQEQQAALTALKYAIIEHTRYTLSATRKHWNEAAGLQRRRKAEVRRLIRRTMGTATRFWIVSKLEEAVDRWNEAAAELQDMQGKIASAAMWWRHLQLVNALQLLRSAAAAARQQQAALQRAVSEWEQLASWKAMLRWQQKAAQLSKLKDGMSQDESYGTQHWNKVMLTRTIEQWFMVEQEEAQMLRNRRDAILTWAENQLVTAMNQWRYQTYLALCAYDACIRSAASWTGGVMMDALAHWRGRASTWRSRAEEGRNKAVSKWTKDLLSSTLSEWREGASSISTGSEYCKQAALWREEKYCREAILRWRDYTEFCGILAELMVQADFRYTHKSYSDGFQSWRSYSDMMVDSPEK